MFSDSATSALSCVLFQHLSKPNNLSPVFVALLWQCFCCVALPVQLLALPVWYHRWAQLQEHQWNPWEAEGEVGKQIKSPVTATDLLILTVIHIGLPLFFFWWKEAEKKGPLLATSLGQLLTFFTVRVRAAAQRLSRALCAAAIGTFCSDVQPSPCQTNSICWNVFPEAVSAMCMCSFSCCSAIQSVCGWSLRSAVPPLLVSVSAGTWCVDNF